MQNDVSYFEHALDDIAQVNGKGVVTSKSLPMALLFQGTFATKFKQIIFPMACAVKVT